VLATSRTSPISASASDAGLIFEGVSGERVVMTCSAGVIEEMFMWVPG
jgi:hypothetical protein